MLNLSTCKTNEEVIKKYRMGANRDRALSMLYEINLPIITKTAYNLGADNNNIDDMVQDGFMGLMRALETYKLDHSSEAGFLTYALPWIRRTMKREQSKYDLVRLPEHERKDYYKLRSTESERKLQGLPVGLDDLAGALRWTVEKVERLKLHNNMLQPASLDVPIGDEEDSTLSETVSNGYNLSKEVEGKLWHDYMSFTLWGEVDKLEAIPRRIIKMFFKENMTGPDIAKALNHSYSADFIYQIRGRAFKKLKSRGNIRALAREDDRLIEKELSDNYYIQLEETVIARMEREVKRKEQAKEKIEEESLLYKLQKAFLSET